MFCMHVCCSAIIPISIQILFPFHASVPSRCSRSNRIKWHQSTHKKYHSLININPVKIDLWSEDLCCKWCKYNCDTLNPSINFRVIRYLIMGSYLLLYLGSGKKPEYPGKTHTYTGRTCKLRTERQKIVIKPGTTLLWGDGANQHTTIQCS